MAAVGLGQHPLRDVEADRPRPAGRCELDYVPGPVPTSSTRWPYSTAAASSSGSATRLVIAPLSKPYVVA
jgi:hypothetical protein